MSKRRHRTVRRARHARDIACIASRARARAASALRLRRRADRRCRRSALTVVDDAGRELRARAAAARIVTLAPSLTELVFAAGGGASLVGASTRAATIPPAARTIARIGDAGRLDVERVIALKPDLVVIWQRGNTSRELEQLEAAGIRLFQLEPRRLDDVARAIERLGAAARPRGGGEPARERDARSARRLRAAHAGEAPVRVFYQVWRQPLMTINGKQMIDDMIEPLRRPQRVRRAWRRWCRQVATESVSPPIRRRC